MALLDDYLTVKQVAKELSVAPNTVVQWSNKPKGIGLPYIKLGRRRLFDIHTTREWIIKRGKRGY